MKVAFIILTWNSEKVIKACVKALLGYQILNNQIVVVDNGSSDNTISDLKKMQKDKKSIHTLEILKLERNVGTTISRNIGVRQVRSADYLCILDSDTVTEEKEVIKMISYLQDHPKVGIVGPKMCDSKGEVQLSGRNFPTLIEKIFKACPIKKLQNKGGSMETPISGGANCFPVDYLMSACWLMPFSVWQDIGPLDEKIFYAPEDVDYCMRAWRKGWEVHYVGNAQIFHEWQRISKRKFFSKMNWEHLKGLVYYFCKYRYWICAPSFQRDKKVRSGSDEKSKIFYD